MESWINSGSYLTVLFSYHRVDRTGRANGDVSSPEKAEETLLCFTVLLACVQANASRREMPSNERAVVPVKYRQRWSSVRTSRS